MSPFSVISPHGQT